MFTPKAFVAVVGIAIANYLLATIFTNKIFYFSYECHSFDSLPLNVRGRVRDGVISYMNYF